MAGPLAEFGLLRTDRVGTGREVVERPRQVAHEATDDEPGREQPHPLPTLAGHACDQCSYSVGDRGNPDEERRSEWPQVAQPIPQKAVVGRRDQHAERHGRDEQRTHSHASLHAREQQGRQGEPEHQRPALRQEHRAPDFTVQECAQQQAHIFADRVQQLLTSEIRRQH